MNQEQIVDFLYPKFGLQSKAGNWKLLYDSMDGHGQMAICAGLWLERL